MKKSLGHCFCLCFKLFHISCISYIFFNQVPNLSKIRYNVHDTARIVRPGILFFIPCKIKI